jgi:Leucine-rich repeat (LRR) protein
LYPYIRFISIVITSSYAANLYYSYREPGIASSFYVENITEVTSANETINVVGEASNYSNPNFKVLFLSSTSVLQYFPIQLFKIFPGIEEILLHSTLLPNIGANTFGSCGNTKRLSLRGLKFTTLPAGFAQNCASLNTLMIQNGDLVTLDEDALSGLNALTHIDFTFNKITFVPATFLASAPELANAYFGGNKITTIDPMTLSGASKLRNIDFAGNQITYVPALDAIGTAMGSESCSIFFHYNPVMALDAKFAENAFVLNTGNATLRFIFTANDPSCSYCIKTCFTQDNAMISSTNWQTVNSTLTPCFSNWIPAMETTLSRKITTTTPSPLIALCASIKYCRYFIDQTDQYSCVLDGVNGALTSITGAHISPVFTDASVTRVYFRNSLLNRIPPVLFSKFPNLEILSVANTSLGNITDSTITQCGNLVQLDARSNGIVTVSSKAFKNCKKLQSVDFTGNPIDKLTTTVFARDTTVKKIVIIANRG